MGSVVSVQVSDLQTVQYRGRDVVTGFFKKPVAGPIWLRPLGLEGDRQADRAVHGGHDMAVYLYPFEHYEYWSTALSRDDLKFGQFGENLTVQGLLENAICIGDVYRVGSAVVQITQPRVSCFKLTMAMNAGDDFASRFMQARRIGFYGRVLEEGTVTRGDAIQLLSRDGANVTVLDYLEASHFSLDLPELRRCRSATALPSVLKKKLDKRTVNALSNKNGGNWLGFQECEVLSVVRETTDVASFLFRPKNPDILVRALPGQFVTVRHVDAADTTRSRPYTISELDPSAGHFRISVRKSDQPGDSLSRVLHEQIGMGDTLDIRGPAGHFALDVEQSNPVLLIAAGIGITPILSMLSAQCLFDKRPVRLIHALRFADQQPLGNDVRRAIAKLPNSRAYLAVSSLPESGATEEMKPGRISESLIAEALESLDRSATLAYICGPPAFCDDVTTWLQKLGLDDANINHETFRPVSQMPAKVAKISSPLRAPRVHCAKSGIDLEWHDDAGSILDLVESAGIAADFACRAGTCGTCAVRLISGEVEYTELVDPPSEDQALICCAVPLGDVALGL